MISPAEPARVGIADPGTEKNADGARVCDVPCLVRFYEDFAKWWPLISPVADYAEEAAFVAGLLRRPGVREVLELGSGGGHNAAYLKAEFTMTLTDISERMLDVSRALNPECRHVQGDMRTLRLGETFDAVFVHDAIEYMLTEDDLRAAVRTAYVHCRPGGFAMFVPDHVAETFEPGSDHGGSDGPDGSGARLMEWTWDPDPADTWVATEYVFVLREADGTVEVAHETHRTALFGRDVWVRVLKEVGFTVETVLEETAEDRRPRELFMGTRNI